MEWIVKVQARQDDFIRIIHDLGEHFYAEDIVQEFYIKLMKYGKEDKVLKDGEPNMSYLYTILKRLFLDFKAEKKKAAKVIVYDKSLSVSYDYYEPSNSENLRAEIIKEVNQWQYFDNELFKLYTGIRDSNRDRTLTMRQIAEGSDISTKTIFYSIKRSKSIIQEKLKQKYYDYIEINNGKIIDTCKLVDPKREDYKDEMEGYN